MFYRKEDVELFKKKDGNINFILGRMKYKGFEYLINQNNFNKPEQ